MDEACVHPLILLPPQFRPQVSPLRGRRHRHRGRNAAAVLNTQVRLAGGSFMKTWSLPDARYFQIGALASLLALNFALIDFGARPAASAIALGSTLLTQFVCARITATKFDWRSAVITGLSLSLLLRADALWIFAAAGAIAISSKFVLRI